MANTEGLSRRQLFGIAAMAGVATAVGGRVSGPRVASAQGPLPTTPDEALAALRAGNERYATSLGGVNNMQSFTIDLQEIRDKTGESQQPFAALLACADARVAPEIIFDQSINRLFVCRVAGNIATPEIIASLEYAVVVLATVKVIMVLGHGNCGAVTNAGGNLGRVPNTQISALYAPLRPGVALGGSSVDNQIRANARVQAALLSQTSPALLDATRTPNQLKIVPAYYDLGTGRVTELPPLVSVTASP
jgi:carbonic anhydrase